MQKFFGSFFQKRTSSIKLLRNPRQNSPPQPKLRRPNPHPGPIPNLIPPIEQIQHIQPNLRPPQNRLLKRLAGGQINHIVPRQSPPIRHRAIGPQPATGHQIGRKPRRRLRPAERRISHPARPRIMLVVIQMNPMILNIRQFRRREIELRRDDLLADRPAIRQVRIERPRPVVVAGGKLNARNLPMLVVEGGQDNRRAELAFINQISRGLKICIYPAMQPQQKHMIHAGVKIIIVLGLHRAVLALRRIGRRAHRARERRRGAGELRVRSAGNQLEWRRREIMRVARMQRGRRRRLPHKIHPRRNLVLVRELVHQIEPRPIIQRQPARQRPFILQIQTINAARLA